MAHGICAMQEVRHIGCPITSLPQNQSITQMSFLIMLLSIASCFTLTILVDQVLDYIEYCRHQRDMQYEYQKYIADQQEHDTEKELLVRVSSPKPQVSPGEFDETN